ncbi:REPTOR-binding partner isoform X1 [Rhipicephalus microplus]|uniref:REPTOR-binding partner isoform X1 n=2 Tax=Rhipicephalus microplus TaxID=6941 RepID=UPI001888188D|nr:cAMP-responsive element-binding protein-like 2 isoform X1 [Rhipicephalus microplus]
MQMETDEYEFHYVKKESAEEEGRGGRRGRRSSGSSVGTSASGGGGRSSSGGGSGSKRCDMRAKLERSRQSARECRARKKLRYQYLEELVADREKAVLVLRHELDMYRQYFKEMDEGNIPEAVLQILEREQEEHEQQIAQQE